MQESSRNDLLFIVCVRTYAFSWGEGLWVSPAGLNLCSGLEPPPPGLPPWCAPAAIALHTPRSPWGLEPWSAAPALEGSLAVSSRLLSPARTLSAALLCSLAQEPWTQAQGPLSPWPHFSIPSPDVSTAAIGGRLGSRVPLGSLLLRPRTEPGLGGLSLEAGPGWGRGAGASLVECKRTAAQGSPVTFCGPARLCLHPPSFVGTRPRSVLLFLLTKACATSCP